MRADTLKEFLTSASNKYAAALSGSQGEVYLASRGISLQAANTARVGFVELPEPGHEGYQGMLCIPYWTKTGVTAVKFRRLDGGSPKYLSPVGQESTLYNVRAVLSGADYVCICEGEMDTLTAHFVCNVNSVGVSGATHWQPYFARVLRGFQNVFIVSDNDEEREGRNPGQMLAANIIRDIPWARNVLLPVGVDINDLTVAKGPNALRDLLGLDAMESSA